MSDPNLTPTGAPSAQDVAAVRLLVKVPDGLQEAFTDDMVSDILAAHPIPDLKGLDPYQAQGPWQGADPFTYGWTPTYDRWAAAADLWAVIAAFCSDLYDFVADRATFNRSQVFAQAMKMARFCNSRRHAQTVVLERDRQLDILYQGRWPFAPMIEGSTALVNDLNEYYKIDQEMYPR